MIPASRIVGVCLQYFAGWDFVVLSIYRSTGPRANGDPSKVYRLDPAFAIRAYTALAYRVRPAGPRGGSLPTPDQAFDWTYATFPWTSDNRDDT